MSIPVKAGNFHAPVVHRSGWNYYRLVQKRTDGATDRSMTFYAPDDAAARAYVPKVTFDYAVAVRLERGKADDRGRAEREWAKKYRGNPTTRQNPKRLPPLSKWRQVDTTAGRAWYFGRNDDRVGVVPVPGMPGGYTTVNAAGYTGAIYLSAEQAFKSLAQSYTARKTSAYGQRASNKRSYITAWDKRGFYTDRSNPASTKLPKGTRVANDRLGRGTIVRAEQVWPSGSWSYGIRWDGSASRYYPEKEHAWSREDFEVLPKGAGRFNPAKRRNPKHPDDATLATVPIVDCHQSYYAPPGNIPYRLVQRTVQGRENNLACFHAPSDAAARVAARSALFSDATPIRIERCKVKGRLNPRSCR